jgi:hypothetical protein
VVLSDNLSHLLDTYSARALLPDEERIEWIKQDRWIHYSRAERVLDRLTALLHYPPRDRMPCVLLFGSTGMGRLLWFRSFFAITVRALTRFWAERARFCAKPPRDPAD